MPNHWNRPIEIYDTHAQREIETVASTDTNKMMKKK